MSNNMMFGQNCRKMKKKSTFGQNVEKDGQKCKKKSISSQYNENHWKISFPVRNEIRVKTYSPFEIFLMIPDIVRTTVLRVKVCT